MSLPALLNPKHGERDFRTLACVLHFALWVCLGVMGQSPSSAQVPEQIRLPAASSVPPPPPQDYRISITANDATIDSVLNLIAEQQGLNVITSGDMSQHITVNLKNVPFNDALESILAANGFAWTQQKDIIIVSKIAAENKGPAMLQGREMRVFTLNYISAVDAEKVATGLLSPVGQAFVNLTVATDQRRTQEQLVVEDVPTYLQRIEEYIAEVDRPPRQVLVEAHILQVQLTDENRHGIDLKNILRVVGSPITLEAKNFTSNGSPAGLLTVGGKDLNGVIEAIQSMTDSKTLASPKVAVLNGQEARIQVGGQIGYLLTTTTQTSTLQSVNFLQVGVILQVTPIITADNQILLDINPEVSSGGINATTSLPESETTQLKTRIMLADGEALLMGGLIKETHIDSRSKFPFLGDLWLIGRLFQRRNHKCERNEIIIALLPRILPDMPGCRNLNPIQVEQAETPLFYDALKPMDRRAWEPTLLDAPTRKGFKKFSPRTTTSIRSTEQIVETPTEVVVLEAAAPTFELIDESPPQFPEPVTIESSDLPTEKFDLLSPELNEDA